MTNLITSIISTGEIHLLFGYSNVTNIRIPSIIDSGAKPILITDTKPSFLPALKQYEADEKLTVLVDPNFADKIQEYITTLGRPEVDGVVDRVFVSLTNESVKQDIYTNCKNLEYPLIQLILQDYVHLLCCQLIHLEISNLVLLQMVKDVN